jgi:hypothetical protein
MASYAYKFNEGDIVYEITRPQQLMLVTRRNGIIYYCRSVSRKNDIELGIMERDLRGISTDQLQSGEKNN